MISKRLALRAGLALCALSLLYLVIASFGGFARPIEGLWPPAKGTKTYRLIVSLDQWHSMLGTWPQDEDGNHTAPALEEWGYAEKLFYLDGDDGLKGTARAMLLPSLGVVQRVRAGRPWSKRTPQPPARQWSFQLSDAGYESLRRHLAGEIASPEPFDVERFPGSFPAARKYHAFHHCHHWTARALRSAGLPVWSSYALFPWSLERQLDRAMQFESLGPQEGSREILKR